MAKLLRITQVGNDLLATFDDGARVFAYPTTTALWLPRATSTAPVDPGDGGGDPDPGDGGGTPGDGTLSNTFAKWVLTGTWADHQSYSAGGIDRGPGYGEPLIAPCAGTLHYNDGAGEFLTGYVGSAGMRSYLAFDTAYSRKQPPSGLVMNGGDGFVEDDGPAVGVVLQHQSGVKPPGHYDKGAIIGYVGNSNGTSQGGDTHIHYHSLSARGRRMDFDKLF